MKNYKQIKIIKPLHKRIKTIAHERKMKLEGLVEILLIRGLKAKENQ
jgi:hypothetical protein